MLRTSGAGRALTSLAELAVPKLCGARCLVDKEPLEWLCTTGSLRLFRELSARGLVWEVVPATGDQMEQISRLACEVPELRITIDHMGRPPVELGGWEPWAGHISRLARSGNVAMKLSVGLDVLTHWRAWDAQALCPYVEEVVTRFGPERLMLASNWPVIQLATSYTRAWRDLLQLVESIGARGPDLDALLGGTAARWYNLL